MKCTAKGKWVIGSGRCKGIRSGDRIRFNETLWIVGCGHGCCRRVRRVWQFVLSNLTTAHTRWWYAVKNRAGPFRSRTAGRRSIKTLPPYSTHRYGVRILRDNSRGYEDAERRCTVFLRTVAPIYRLCFLLSAVGVVMNNLENISDVCEIYGSSALDKPRFTYV